MNDSLRPHALAPDPRRDSHRTVHADCRRLDVLTRPIQMTHLGTAISRLLLQNKLLAKDVARKAGIDPSYLSRVQRGQVGISVSILASLALAISDHQSDRAELVASHMKDQSCGFWPDLIQISTNGKRSEGKLHPNIEYLQAHLHDKNVRKAVESIVEIHRSGKPGGKRKNE